MQQLMEMLQQLSNIEASSDAQQRDAQYDILESMLTECMSTATTADATMIEHPLEPEVAERTSPLFTPWAAGELQLAHRIVLAPMTRIRANPTTMAPTALNVLYYSQRATSGGLITSEAINVSPEATPVWEIYARVRESGDCAPGIWTDEQTERWREVVDAVHEKGCLITAQLGHAGRVAQKQIGEHPIVKGTDCSLPPVSSSAVKIPVSQEEGNHYNWDQPQSTPRALSTQDVTRLVNDFATAAANAKRAGFDNVEIHAGNP